MAISRMQEPRQLYGLGSLVKSIGKGVKKFVKSPLGKAAILGAVGFGIPGTGIGGLFGRAAIGGQATGLLGKAGIQATLPSLFGVPGGAPGKGSSGIFSKIFDKLGTGGKLGIGTGIATYLLSQGKSKEEVEAITQDKDALSTYLAQYYKATNPDASDIDVQEFVEVNTREYDATGGRVGLKDGPKKYMFNDVLREPKSDLERASVGNPGTKEMYKSEILKMLAENRDEAKTKMPMKQKPFKPDLEKIKKLIEKKKKGLAAGGMPTGIMRTNQAGVMERDYRDEGGFVPVGIKERADDVPAMLSKNEFVMTADAVRGAGDGSIEKGAQRMYDQMKNLESKVA